MRELGLKDKKAAVFGSYGWSGESVKMITSGLEEGGFEIVNEGMKVLWNPDEDIEKECFAYGKTFSKQLNISP